MDTDLSPHSHTNKCNELIQQFNNCYVEHSIRKFFGFCSSLDAAVTKCLKEEWLRRVQLNYEKSLEMKAKLRIKFEEDRNRQTAKNT